MVLLGIFGLVFALGSALPKISSLGVWALVALLIIAGCRIVGVKISMQK